MSPDTIKNVSQLQIQRTIFRHKFSQNFKNEYLKGSSPDRNMCM